jgi:hypothetical protein
MKKTILLILILAVSTALFAQTEAITKDGKKVLLNQDGTWKYKNTADTTSIDLECADLVSTETDKMTGETTTASKRTIVISEDGGKTGFGLYLMSLNGVIIFNIQAVGAGSCIDDDDKMNILFRDGTRLELKNNSKFNCKGKFNLYFGGSFGKKKQLEMFRTKEIETMRVWTSRSYVEKDFSSEKSKIVMKTIDCLLK